MNRRENFVLFQVHIECHYFGGLVGKSDIWTIQDDTVSVVAPTLNSMNVSIATVKAVLS